MKGKKGASSNDGISIDNETLSIVLPIKNTDGHRVYVFLPDVPEEYVNPAVPILEHIYGESARKGYPAAVFIRDYKHYIDEAAKINSMAYEETEREQIEAYKRIKDNFNRFLMMSLTGASIVDPEEGKYFQYPAYAKRISEKEKEKIEGWFIFFYSFGRYTRPEPKKAVKDGYGWSSSVSEYLKFLTNFLSNEPISENIEGTDTTAPEI